MLPEDKKQKKMKTWTEIEIERCLNKMVKTTGQTTMPTHSEMTSFFGDHCLVNAVKRHGGTEYWATRMNLTIKDCESKIGDYFEKFFAYDLRNRTGMASEKMPIKYPYDVLVEGCLKVDIKASHLYKNGYYTFNLEKKHQTCDVYVAYCLGDDSIEKVYIIPASELNGISQLSVGKNISKYDEYVDRWDIIQDYVNFMKKYRQIN